VEHLLFLAHRIPYPPTKGDKVRSYHLLQHLASRYRVHLGAFVDDETDLAHAAAVRSLCDDCHLVALSPLVAKVRSLTALIWGEPLTLSFYRSSSMQQWVNRVLRSTQIQKVLVFSSAMAQYVMSVKEIHRVADLVDVDSDKWRQYAGSFRWPLSAVYRRESEALLRYEREIARQFDATIFVSAAEARLFCKLAPEAAHKVSHLNNGVDTEYFSPDRSYANPYPLDERVVVFTGAMDYRPNIDAVVWFAYSVLPRILQARSNICFYIVGARPAPAVRNLANLPGVRVTGTVPDVRPYVAHARLAVAPLRMARGVQNKVLEAMAMAKPVLASPHAAEGIETQPGVGLLVAVDEVEFVTQALRLMQDDDAARAMGVAGREHVLRCYRWDRSLSRLSELLVREGGITADTSSVPESALCALGGARRPL
jgi:sugar transferase (PEP-CTERM/EpsH1 system associated)